MGVLDGMMVISFLLSSLQNSSVFRAQRCRPLLGLLFGVILTVCVSACGSLAGGNGASEERSLNPGSRDLQDGRGVGGRGMWIAAASPSSLLDYYEAKWAVYSVNRVLPATDRTTHAELVELAQKLSPQMRLIPWFQPGIKFKGNFYGQENLRSLYLTCHEDYVYYLNVTLAEARKVLVDKLVSIARIPGISGIHLDDHMGFDIRQMTYVNGSDTGSSCIGRSGTPSEDELRRGLTLLVKEIATAIRRAAPRVFIEYSHHNASYSNRYFLADWERWMADGSVDRMVTQAYVPRNLDAEISKAKSSGVKGLGLYPKAAEYQSNPSQFGRDVRKIEAAGLEVYIFRVPDFEASAAGLQPRSVADPSGISVRPEPEPVPPDVPSSAPTPKTTSADHETDEPTEPAEPAAGGACGAMDLAGLKEQCRSSRGLEVVGPFPECAKVVCRARGGGFACDKNKSWNKAFTCDEILPQISF